MNKRTLGIGLALIMGVAAVLAATRPATPVSAEVATFASYRGDELVRRGSFLAGELVATPSDGRVDIRVGDATLRVGPASDLRVPSLAPLQVRLLRGEMEVETRDGEVLVQDGGKAITVGAGAHVRFRAEPASLSVARGVVRIGGQSRTGDVTL